MLKDDVSSGGDDEGSRARLLAALRELMTERRSVDVSVSDIAAAAGVNPGLIRYYFKSKEGLYRALLREVATVALSQFHRLMAMDLSPIAKLEAHIAGTIDTYCRHPYLNQLVHHLQQSQEIDSAKEVALSFVNPLTFLQRQLLEQGERAGLFIKTDPMLMYFIMMGACDHLFYAKHVLHFTFDVEEVSDALRRKYTEHVSRIILGGVLKSQAPAVEAARAAARRRKGSARARADSGGVQ